MRLDEIVNKKIAEGNRVFSAIHKNEIPKEYKNLKILGRGATSIVLEKNPETVIILTRDNIKKDWLLYSNNNVNWIDTIESNYHTNPKIKDLPIYVLEMPKLFKLSPENKKLLNKFIKKFNEFKNKRSFISFNKKKAKYDMFDSIVKEFGSNEQDILYDLIQFLYNYDPSDYSWDLSSRNIMQDKEGKIVILDPVVSNSLFKAYGYNF